MDVFDLPERNAFSFFTERSLKCTNVSLVTLLKISNAESRVRYRTLHLDNHLLSDQ